MNIKKNEHYKIINDYQFKGNKTTAPERNEVRQSALNMVVDLLVSNGFYAKRSEKGIAVEFPNDKLGCVIAECTIVMKNEEKESRKYVDDEHENYLAKIELKKQKDLAKAKEKKANYKAVTEQRERLKKE